MQYLGGKHAHAAKIAAFLKTLPHADGAPFVDVFAGALNITAAMDGAGMPRVANDANPALVCLWRAWREGWRPDPIDEQRWRELRAAQDCEDPHTAFAGFALSFGGKWFAGFARSHRVRCYFTNGVNSLTRKIARCADVQFTCQDYRALEIPDGVLVYLDPPYAQTTHAWGPVPAFGVESFRAWARDLSRRATVVLSEYDAPAPWVVAADFGNRTGRGIMSTAPRRSERLWRISA